ncbi:hypothetical protein WA026_004884 [Henosepilachna vigintioctopunctata]|uniref:Protein misato n=2 Tax=cellular organisms TaxID=131567 RepID=A0AAW1USW7_9CUCU
MNYNRSGEILTLQFGHYSNYVGTHWWNIQEKTFQYSGSEGPQEIDHDVLYREGVNQKGQITFTPRLLAVDLKGSLRALSESSEVYEEIPDCSKVEVRWDPDKVEIKKSERVNKNKFQQDLDDQSGLCGKSHYNLETDVKVWSDFLYARFHPRTINIIKEYQHQNDSPFNTFPLGQELWKTEQFEEEFADKIRSYMEESDYFQGFQIILDAVDGFAGLSTSCIEYLQDEYRRSVLAFPTIPSFYSDYNFKTETERHQSLIKDSNRVLNIAFCFNALQENSSLFVPLCTGEKGWRQPGKMRNFSHCKYVPELYYHSAAILASALDTASLRYRLKSGVYTLQDLCSDLSSNRRTAAAGSLCLPFSLNSDDELISCLDNWIGPLTQTITPNCTLGTEHMVQLYSLRGISEERLKKPLSKAGRQKSLPAYKCETIKDMLSFYLECTTTTSINNVTVIEKGLPVGLPYPKLFDELVQQNGNIGSIPRYSTEEVNTIPVLAGLHNGAGVGDMLESLHVEMKKLKFGKFHQFKVAGLEVDDFVECLDSLFEFRERYEDNYYL